MGPIALFACKLNLGQSHVFSRAYLVGMLRMVKWSQKEQEPNPWQLLTEIEKVIGSDW